MPKYFSRQLLYRIRNEIPLRGLLIQLEWPNKDRAGRFSFLCPECGEFLTATNPRTNLGRCFSCARNYNTIDFVMAVQQCDFVAAVHYLEIRLKPASPIQP